MCLWTRNRSASASWAGMPSRWTASAAIFTPHFAMVFQVSLAQVVEQQRQVQQVLLGQRTVDPAQRPRSDQSSVANSTARRQCSSTVYLWYWLNCSSPRA